MDDLTTQLQGIVQRVTKLLPASFEYNESSYQAVMARELKKSKAFGSYLCSTEVTIPYKLDDGFYFGYGRADIILEDRKMKRCIIIELKAGTSAKYQQCCKYKAQVSKYVKHYNTSCVKRGVVVIFNPSYYNRSFKIEIT